LWILKGRADHQGIDSLRKMLHIDRLIVLASRVIGLTPLA
jgi:hypothetical protein